MAVYIPPYLQSAVNQAAARKRPTTAAAPAPSRYADFSSIPNQANGFSPATAGNAQSGMPRVDQSAPPVVAQYGPTVDQRNTPSPAAPAFDLPDSGNSPSSGLDYSGDPLLQRTLMANKTKYDTDVSNSDTDAWKTLLGFGSQQLAQKYFPNDAKVNSITSDPAQGFTTLGNMQHSFDTSKRQANEGWNDNNLFYSGARNQGLGEMGRNYLSQVNDATSGVEAQLTGYIRSKAQAASDMQAANLTAEQAAYQRAVDAAALKSYAAKKSVLTGAGLPVAGVEVPGKVQQSGDVEVPQDFPAFTPPGLIDGRKYQAGNEDLAVQAYAGAQAGMPAFVLPAPVVKKKALPNNSLANAYLNLRSAGL